MLNGKAVSASSEPDTPVLWVLRDELGQVGTKYGCGAALCGACTVHLDGAPVRACQTPLGSVAGRKVTTIEGATSKVAIAIKKAWIDSDVPQCGYCQPGQVMAASALLATNKNPVDADIDAAMSGNLCRCGTYARIKTAIKAAAAELRKA